MIATLPMYDYPEVREATDSWWAAIARHAGVGVALSRPDDFMAPWTRADLAFSQTCGYPFTHHLNGKIGLVGTPHYAVRGCDGLNYSSFVLAREPRTAAGFRGTIAAVNNVDSMSGMLALKHFFLNHARDGQFFGAVRMSGGHLKSLELLQRGDADVCAVDAVCVGYVRRHQPQLLEGLYEIGQTPFVPGLPYVSNDTDISRWRKAVSAAVADPALKDIRDALMINGFTATVPDDYDIILALEREIDQRGGLALL